MDHVEPGLCNLNVMRIARAVHRAFLMNVIQEVVRIVLHVFKQELLPIYNFQKKIFFLVAISTFIV